ncbi:MAG TPA: hypothetical protein VNL12_19535 [Iamia sp.]|nr:hypothetical protein [Iamia sp.]
MVDGVELRHAFLEPDHPRQSHVWCWEGRDDVETSFDQAGDRVHVEGVVASLLGLPEDPVGDGVDAVGVHAFDDVAVDVEGDGDGRVPSARGGT